MPSSAFLIFTLDVNIECCVILRCAEKTVGIPVSWFFLTCKNCWEWLYRPDSTVD